MAFLGDFGKALSGIATGALTGFFGSGGSPWGALLGGVGGLFGSKDKPQDRVQTVIPPTTQEAYNIVKGLEGQVGDIALKQYNIQRPLIDEAYSIFKSSPTIYDALFREASGDIANKYAGLFNNIQTQMQNQWSKSALGLSALGMYNTPATALTQSDIVSQLFGRVAEAETKDLVGLDKDRLNTFLNYYDKAPQVLSSFSDIYSSINPDVNKFDLQLKLAGVLNGLSSNVALLPKASPLQQISGALNNYLKNSAKDVPDFGQTFSGLVNKLEDIFS